MRAVCRLFVAYLALFCLPVQYLCGEECTCSPCSDCCQENDAPPKIGNFSLPTSQQPATLFGFGNNIIDKGELQLSLFADAFAGKRRKNIDLVPNIVYGITDKWSISFYTPFTPKYENTYHRSSGALDFFAGTEYAFYSKSTSTYADQATVLVNLTAPTGSTSKNPQTGLGSPSVFLGGTFYRTMVEWFLFTAQGVLLPTSYHGTKFGNQYLYQFGFGRNFWTPKGWIYAWMVDIDGLYSCRNRFRGSLDRNSGGNVMYVTPSLWISSKELSLQFGVGFPVYQNLFGSQNTFDYVLNFNVSWSFYDL